MLVAPKYEGLDLPIHDPDTFVATNWDLQTSFRDYVVRDYTVARFVRTAAIQLRDLSHAPSSAAELLEWTDRELEAVAERCGALVVDYEWGLYPVHDKLGRYRQYLPNLQGLGGIIDLPRNHILVAEVDVIKPASEAAERGDSRADANVALSHAAIATGTAAYYEAGYGTYQLFDLRDRYTKRPRTEQFVLGAPIPVPDAEETTYLVDIDSRFQLTR